jgi:NAD(P)H-hydrate epimerase
MIAPMEETTPLPSRVIRAIDERAITVLGIPGILLMENAGAAVARHASALALERGLRRLAIVCGTGNNGGDGFVAARHLHGRFEELRVWLVGGRAGVRGGDAAVHAGLLDRLGIPIEEVGEMEALRAFLVSPALVIDALFGTGLTRPVEGRAAEVVRIVNGGVGGRVAVDVPSGLEADSGEVLGVAVRADVTVTFVRPKPGFYRGGGPSHVGRVVVEPIGVPESLVPAGATRFHGTATVPQHRAAQQPSAGG